MGTIGKPILKQNRLGRAVLLLDDSVVPPQVAQLVAQKVPAPGDAQLIAALRKLIACTYTMYVTAHAAHWNVEGAVFPSYHAFFGEVYADVFGSVDPFAEAIRQHGGYVPAAFGDLLNGTIATPAPFQGGDKTAMVSALIAANTMEMACLTDVRVAADTARDEGLANFCQERLAVHLKIDWQLKAMAA